MADHFGSEIVFILGFVTFIAVMFGMFSADYQEAGFNAYQPTVTSDANEAWLSMGSDLQTLEQTIPLEIFVLIIVPIIVLGLYITLKTASGILPNWISGG